MTYPPKDVTNQTFGTLTALNPTEFRSRNGLGSIMWSCICTCGNTRLVSVASLLRHETVSCGKRSCRKNYKEKTKRERAILRYYNTYRDKATKRELLFNLTQTDFLVLIKQVCAYCGDSTNTILINDGRDLHVRLRANGIDRKDNTLGYVADNVVPCCTTCNYAKRMLTVQEYIDHCKKVVAFNQ